MGGTAPAVAPIDSGSEATTACNGSPGIANAPQEELDQLRAELEAARSGHRQAELERDEERQGRIAAERALSEARREAEQALETAAALRKAKETAAAEERAEQITRDAAFAQLRRLAEAMAARRSLGRWARLRLAWRGE